MTARPRTIYDFRDLVMEQYSLAFSPKPVAEPGGMPGCTTTGGCPRIESGIGLYLLLLRVVKTHDSTGWMTKVVIGQLRWNAVPYRRRTDVRRDLNNAEAYLHQLGHLDL